MISLCVSSFTEALLIKGASQIIIYIALHVAKSYVIAVSLLREVSNRGQPSEDL
jgi:hypothetical protein